MTLMDGHVQFFVKTASLNLENNPLAGTVPSELGRLVALGKEGPVCAFFLVGWSATHMCLCALFFFVQRLCMRTTILYPELFLNNCAISLCCKRLSLIAI